ncbi:DUF4097 family beta strand repeat-containing protein [Streptomyces sp. NPDC020875]|uniref:DUF4097 family beta strand repeat-containing protein n=1 Tax=Streptomyces sp. NPDC020875 TaxID=3154898 RepID=UPI0033DA3B02
MNGRTIRGIVAIGVGGAAMAGLVGCGTADAGDAEVERKAFAFAGDVLTVDVDDSDVTLVPADVTEVKVSRQVDGWELFGDGPDPVWRMEDGRLTLRTGCGGVGNCEARHTVEVPRGVALTVKSDNGKVTASGFTGKLDLSTDNGDVVVRDTTGELRLSSDNGNVRAEGVSARKIWADTDNGDLKVRMKGAADQLEASSDNGDVVVELAADRAPYAVTARSDNGSRKVEVPEDDGSPRVVRATNENGNVTVRVAG